MAESNGMIISPLLSAVAVNYKNPQMAYVAGKLMPAIPVPKKLFKYLVWNDAESFKTPETQFAPGTSPNRQDPTGTLTDGGVDYHGLTVAIDDDEVEQLGPGIPVQTYKTASITDDILRRREINVANKVQDTANYDAANVVPVGAGDKFDNAASDPETFLDAIFDKMIVRPDIFWATTEVLSKLRTHAKIKDTVKYTQKGKVPLEALAELFRVQEIVECAAWNDTAAKGKARTLGRIWGKNCGFLCTNRNANPGSMLDGKTMSWGYMPTLRQPVSIPGGAEPSMAVYVARDPLTGTGQGVEVVKVETSYRPLVVAKSGGALLTGAIA
jgi:hypothetical protein